MLLSTRKLLDKAFTGLGVFAIVIMAGSLIVLLAPIVYKGAGAFVFRATHEHRRFLLEHFDRGDAGAMEAEAEKVAQARWPVYQMLTAFEAELAEMPAGQRRDLQGDFADLKDDIRELFGPPPGAARSVLPRDQYGRTRWDRARITLGHVLMHEEWDYSDPDKMGELVLAPRAPLYEGTALAPLFPYLEDHMDQMMAPRWTLYLGFLFDRPVDAFLFGGIWPALLGTFYLTLGAMLIATPMGVIAAIYFVEYARDGYLVSLLRSCVGALAGVPSIVFGLFGLAFFINTMQVSQSKSVLAGSLTLALLVLPTVIRAAEEAIRAVPNTYREAALALGTGKWRTITTVTLPAAASGILTGVIISMGRAAGETAPIIFTAAVSQGAVLALKDVFTQPTLALPWSIYNLSTEHEAASEIRHVQFGMVLTLVMLVLTMNLFAIVLRARIAKKLRG